MARSHRLTRSAAGADYAINRQSPDQHMQDEGDNNEAQAVPASEPPSSNERLADYFAIVGLPDELRPLDYGYDCKYLTSCRTLSLTFKFHLCRNTHH